MTIRLQCTGGCREGRFEALNAPVFVDARADIVEVDVARAAYVCAACRSVAIDVAAAAREMLDDEEQATETLTCPACRTEMLPPEDDPLADLVECPACGQRFTPEEGRDRLLGGLAPRGDPELN